MEARQLSENDPVGAKELQASPDNWTVDKELPFCPSVPTEISFLSAMCGTRKASQCMGRVGDSDQCKRPRSCGNYCKQHADMAKQKGSASLFKSIKELMQKIFETKKFDEDLNKVKQQ